MFALFDFDRKTSIRVSLEDGVVTFACGRTDADVSEPPTLVSMEADGIRDLVLALEALERVSKQKA